MNAPIPPGLEAARPPATETGVPAPVHYEQLVAELSEIARHTGDAPITLGGLFERLQTAGFALVCLVLALPFLQPVSLGPFATVAGFAFVALGWQMLRGRPTPWLPARLAGMKVSGKLWHVVLEASIKLLRWCRKFTRPRMRRLVTGETGRHCCALLIIAGGVLMTAPFIGVPFNNMFPALVVFCACLGELEGDGMMVVAAVFWVVVSVLFFGAVIVGAVLLGDQMWDWLRQWLPSWV